MSEFVFKKASVARSRARIAITGGPGMGKTLGALLLAHGIGGKIAVIDTERGANDYARGADIETPRGLERAQFNFDVLELEAPFSARRYEQALQAAVAQGYEVVVIDSLSHEWNGKGGAIQQVDAAMQGGRSNKFTAWNGPSQEHDALMQALIQAPCHVIATMRTKMAYEISNDSGKAKPVKIGMEPIQRDGTAYEFRLSFDVDQNHGVSVGKANTSYGTALERYVREDPRLTIALGKKLREWIEAAPAADALSPLLVLKDKVEGLIARVEDADMQKLFSGWLARAKLEQDFQKLEARVRKNLPEAQPKATTAHSNDPQAGAPAVVAYPPDSSARSAGAPAVPSSEAKGALGAPSVKSEGAGPVDAPGVGKSRGAETKPEAGTPVRPAPSAVPEQTPPFGNAAPTEKPKRSRRTKEQMEAARAAERAVNAPARAPGPLQQDTARSMPEALKRDEKALEKAASSTPLGDALGASAGPFAPDPGYVEDLLEKDDEEGEEFPAKPLPLRSVGDPRKTSASDAVAPLGEAKRDW